jgi:hypothetical protein
LSNGHPVECLPGGRWHSKANLAGRLALATDPAVDSASFDTGFAPDEKNLRAPDIAESNVPDAPGWVRGAPPLAVEYADVNQDHGDFKDKMTLRYSGTGLGLALCMRLVTRMAGEIGAPGEGSRFWFSLTLPLGEAPATAVPFTARPDTSAALGWA